VNAARALRSAERTTGTLPVREHLRPKPHPLSWCPVYSRLDEPLNVSTWRRYDVTDYLPLESGYALRIWGEA
jgi:hypothetical protein